MKIMRKFSLFLILGLVMTIHTGANAENLTIGNSAELVNFIGRVNNGESFAGSTVTLAGDIDMGGVDWSPCGTEKRPFAGTFDGNNHQIINLSKAFPTGNIYDALFGYNKGTIKNLTVEAAYPTGEGWDAGLSQWNDGSHNFGAIIVAHNVGNIDSCESQGHLTIENAKSFSFNGGICGYNTGTITNCINKANVNATNSTSWNGVPTVADCYAGGIAGLNEGTITGCTNIYQTSIKANAHYGSAAAGGIVGDNRKGGIISNCNYGSGNIEAITKFAMNMGYAYAGGVVGSNGGTVVNTPSNQAVVKAIVHGGGDNSYRFNYGDVGGVCGYNYGTIDSCNANEPRIMGGVYSYAQTSYQVYAGGVVGYNRGTIKNVKSTSTYEESSYEDRKVSPDYMGGICGYNKDGIIFRAVNNSIPAVNAQSGRDRYIGGIAAANDGGYILLSGSAVKAGNKTTKGLTAGGIVATNSGVVENCYNSASISSTGYTVGGIAAVNTGNVINCYAGMVTGTSKDGIVYDNQGYVSSCYGVTDTKCEGGKKVTSAALKKKETFADWDFDVFWYQANSSFFPVIADNVGELLFFGEGDGTAANPYMITNQWELNRVRYQPDKHYRMMNNITLSGNWAPIGNCRANAFTGSFDGNGHTIYGMILNGNASLYNGLFGYVDGGEIYNLTLSDAVVTVKDNDKKGIYAGGFVGFARNNAVIENCAFNGTITAEGETVAVGAIAADFEGTIKGCRSTGTLTANAGDEFVYSFIGGICGKAEGVVSGCNSEAKIKAIANDNSGYPMETSGGIIGRMKGEITDCCYDGTVDVTDYKTVYHGGIVGSIQGNVVNSYSDYEMSYGDSMNGALAGQVMQGGATGYFNENTSYDSYGTGRANFTGSSAIELLKRNAVEKKYVWVKASQSGKPEPIYVTCDWMVDDNGFTRCVLTPNSEDVTIYYTTDGTRPTQQSALYEGPILANLMDKVSYCVVSKGVESEVMGFVSAPHASYDIQIAKIPENQAGEKITAENITSATSITVDLLTEKDMVEAKVFLTVFDSENRMVYARTMPYSLVKGSNSLTFTDLQIPSGEKLQIYVWDNEMKLIPRSKAIKL